MPSLKEVRNRISSVSSTRQITSAMKLVSASKLKRAQDNITRMRPYADKLKEILGNLSGAVSSDTESPYAEQREAKRILLVVVTANKGLCGAFNANVIKRASAFLEEHAAQVKSGNLELICIGRKASGFFSKRDVKVRAQFDEVVDKPTFANANGIAELIMGLFAEKVFDKVYIVYNEFRSAASITTVVDNYLPITSSDDKSQASAATTDYIYQPSKEEIVYNLIPASLKTQFFKVILDSQAAEHGARMTAMHKATDNAGELLKELKLSYNKARQAAITNEILEIVGGAEALNG
ncbi:MAG: ATP synthase F1 subunit gamma [Bacteroidia bacterium]|nr:ATP synthase F1 subunit gamma [Bacteroidia bacterium]